MTSAEYQAYQAKRGTKSTCQNMGGALFTTPKPNKFRAVKTEVDGHVFASKKEAARYGALRALERAGAIQWLELQPEYRLEVGGVLVAKYRGDFRYTENGQIVVEDTKGFKTPVYKLKKKLMLALHGITIKET